MPHSIRPGDVLAGRYRLVDLLSESGGGRFWRAHDRILERHVALHVIGADDARADGLLAAARSSATVLDQRLLRVLDAERADGICYVVNEWGSGVSLDIMLAGDGPLAPRRAAWLVAEVADSIAVAHAQGVTHGRLVPENVLVDRGGAVRVIGFAVDAALHGLPAGSTETDVSDLAGLLYAALTGKWPGVSASAVPEAPLAHARPLRPRQVRAGVPRPLDDLCDEVLGPLASRHRDGRDLSTARAVAAYLSEFVGDPTGMAEAMAAAIPPRDETVVLPQVPEFTVRPDTDDPTEPGTSSAIGARPAPQVGTIAPPTTAPSATAARQPPPAPTPEMPTQASLPVFDDDIEEASWLEAPSEPAAPPPPFEEPPERPLFAPDPVDGAPLRRRRPGTADDADSAEYWPWGTGPETGRTAYVAPADTDPTGELDRVPGRSWFRLALGILVALLLLVAVVVAINLGRGRTPLGAEPDDTAGAATPDADPSTAPTALTGLTADDFDPQGADREEYPELAALAVDGDPTTAWTTQTYDQNLGPGGLKNGVGLVLDLGEQRAVSGVDLTLVGQPTGVSLYVTDAVPAVRDLTPVYRGTARTQAKVTLEQPATGRYLTVWLTSLPALPDGRFRGEIAEIVVLG